MKDDGGSSRDGAARDAVEADDLPDVVRRSVEDAPDLGAVELLPDHHVGVLGGVREIRENLLALPGRVVLVQASTTGTVKDESFWRLTATKQGLLYFRIEETDGPSTLFDIGRITGATSSDPSFLNIGFQQDFAPARFAYIVEIGSRIFYSVDATDEFVWPSPGFPSPLPTDFTGAIFEILSGPTVGYFYVEYADAVEQTACPVAAMPIGPGGIT